MDILRKLYRGQLAPHEAYRLLDAEHEKRRTETIEMESAFMQTLKNDETKQAFIRILDERTGLTPLECECIFLQGLRMGAELALGLTGWKRDVPEKKKP